MGEFQAGTLSPLEEITTEEETTESSSSLPPPQVIPPITIPPRSTPGRSSLPVFNPFLVGTPSPVASSMPGRRPTSSPAGPPPKRAKQANSSRAAVDNIPLTPGDVDQLLRATVAKGAPGNAAHMRPGVADVCPTAPESLPPSAPVPTPDLAPDRIPSPFAVADDFHALTMSDQQLVHILQAYGLNVSRRDVLRHLYQVHARETGALASESGTSFPGTMPLHQERQFAVPQKTPITIPVSSAGVAHPPPRMHDAQRQEPVDGSRGTEVLLPNPPAGVHPLPTRAASSSDNFTSLPGGPPAEEARLTPLEGPRLGGPFTFQPPPRRTTSMPSPQNQGRSHVLLEPLVQGQSNASHLMRSTSLAGYAPTSGQGFSGRSHLAPGVLLQAGNLEVQGDSMQRPARVFHGLPPEVGRLLSAADKVFPHKVIRALEGGMLEYIPLNLLTDEACRAAAHEPPPAESAFVIANGKLRLPVTSFDTSKEDKLSFDEWGAATDNLVDAMHKHLRAGEDAGSGGHVANVIADSFARHFKYLKNMNNARLLFPVILHYDRRLRGIFIRESHTFRMDTFQNDIWHECLSDLHTSRVDTLNNRLVEMESFLAKARSSAPPKYKEAVSGSYSKPSTN
ncbi:hypothetical protein C0992_003150 [Termitomyces sp. T32_za158]|nr:hypothetical protein C0992_003150 [Termitomyces sp. T32_za158]